MTLVLLPVYVQLFSAFVVVIAVAFVILLLYRCLPSRKGSRLGLPEGSLGLGLCFMGNKSSTPRTWPQGLLAPRVVGACMPHLAGAPTRPCVRCRNVGGGQRAHLPHSPASGPQGDIGDQALQGSPPRALDTQVEREGGVIGARHYCSRAIHDTDSVRGNSGGW